jgi:hypothetical protein
MAAVVNRLALSDATAAGSRPMVEATRRGVSIASEDLHRIVVVAAARRGWSSSPGSATASAGGRVRASPWWSVPWPSVEAVAA